MSAKKKRLYLLVFIFIAFVVYSLALDPDVKLLENLPFGAGLLLTIQVLLMTSISIAIIETISDLFTDRYFAFFDKDNVKDIVEKDPKALSIYMLAWSVRILAYGIVTAGVVMAYVGN